MTVQGWRAWYTNGSTWDSHQATPYDLPLNGLQIVVVYFREEFVPNHPYRNILLGGDYLVWNGHQWQSVMEPPSCPTCRIFPGSWMDDDTFYMLQQQALASERL